MVILVIASPTVSHVHSNRLKNLLSSSNLDLDHDITGHKLPKYCESGTIQIEHIQMFVLSQQKSLELKYYQNRIGANKIAVESSWF